ncbi:aspartic peptidase domain-containing protein [Pyrenochaeta sp. MPI-SDFR-AT-0127]|nr:aspartic peptidase domain-containing protein [Pyrenochaeta sp. MPI-SDFR-AT-0127]
MVAVTFGDSKEEYHLLLDSAASNTWVMAQDCNSAACKTHNTFGTGDSTTLKTDSKTFSVTYGTGSVSGTLATDTLHIGPLSPSLTFGLATTVSQEFRSYPMDGILGIGRGVVRSGSISAPQVMDVLASNSLIGAKLYGIHLSRNKDGKMDGELNLGEVNKERFSGDLNYLDAVENETGFWEVAIADAGVDGKKAGLSGRTAIIDTGTSFILMPKADALAIHSQIQGFKQDGETFSVPCDSTAVIQFAFGQQVYDISNADWKGGKTESGLCRSNIIGRQTFSEKQWLVGDVFLKNVYSVFDFDNKKVGFGVKSDQGSTNSAPSATGESTSPTPTASDSAPSTASTGSNTISSGAAVPASSQAGSSVSGGPASPTAAAETQAQGQKEQSGAANRASSSVFALGVMLISLFIQC